MKKEQKTPFDYSQPIGLSDAPAKSAGRKFSSDKPWSGPTPMDHKKPTSADEAIDAIPGATKSHPMLERKAEKTPVTYGNATMIKQDKSGERSVSPDPVNQVPRKWHKRGYDKETPSSLPSGSRLAKKWELSK